MQLRQRIHSLLVWQSVETLCREEVMVGMAEVGVKMTRDEEVGAVVEEVDAEVGDKESDQKRRVGGELKFTSRESREVMTGNRT